MTTEEAVARLKESPDRLNHLVTYLIQELDVDDVLRRGALLTRGVVDALPVVLSALEAERRLGAETQKMLDEWQEWGDVLVAKIEPLPDGAVWGTPEVRQFIGEAVDQRDAERRRADAATAHCTGLTCFACRVAWTPENDRETCDLAHRETWHHEWVSRRVIEVTQRVVEVMNERDALAKRADAAEARVAELATRIREIEIENRREKT